LEGISFDYQDVNCDGAREALSALLDGEPPGADVAEVEEHVAQCSACEKWRDRTHELTRRVRLQPAGPLPRPTDGLMDAVRRERRVGWWWPTSLTAARTGLLIVACAQLALSVPVLVFGQDNSAPLHVAHEMGSFDLAVAVGFLVAVRRPGRAMGMASLVGAAAGLLVLTAVVDLVAGRTDLADEVPHLLVVVGWLLLRRLASIVPPTWERPRGVMATIGAAWLALTGRRVHDLEVASLDTTLAGVAASTTGPPEHTSSGPTVTDEARPGKVG